MSLFLSSKIYSKFMSQDFRPARTIKVHLVQASSFTDVETGL